MSGLASLCELVTASMLCAAALALVTSAEPDKPSVLADRVAAPSPQLVRQHGTVIAVSANSVTARSADGYTQTYLFTPNTAVITGIGSRTAPAPSSFAVNDHVDIVGTVRGGTVLATAVADRDAGREGGAPMDFLADQPVAAGDPRS
jgi:hypothetical protein